jgi:hypothetical protein
MSSAATTRESRSGARECRDPFRRSKFTVRSSKSKPRWSYRVAVEMIQTNE